MNFVAGQCLGDHEQVRAALALQLDFPLARLHQS